MCEPIVYSELYNLGFPTKGVDYKTKNLNIRCHRCGFVSDYKITYYPGKQDGDEDIKYLFERVNRLQDEYAREVDKILDIHAKEVDRITEYYRTLIDNQRKEEIKVNGTKRI